MSQITNFEKRERVGAVVNAGDWTELQEVSSAAGELAGFLRRHRRVLVVTGAGCSTESGLPDYRGPSGVWRHKRPMTLSEFLRSHGNRRYYWARGFVGWQKFARALPNEAHEALASLERHARISAIVTQNVDGLHHRAGSRSVVELHGSLHRVRCLDCQAVEGREEVQSRMAEENGSWVSRGAEMRADADADIAIEDTSSFREPRCVHCEGVLKPDVVFFGESIPRATADSAWGALDRCDGILAVGSSLSTFSSFRLLREAATRRLEIAILNRGVTRADDLATAKLCCLRARASRMCVHADCSLTIAGKVTTNGRAVG